MFILRRYAATLLFLVIYIHGERSFALAQTRPQAEVALVTDTSDPDDISEAVEGVVSPDTGQRGKRALDGGLLDAIGPWRPFLERHGITLDASETSDLLGNPFGGVRQGGIYEGLLSIAAGLDLGKAVGVPGGSVNISFNQQHSGPGLSASNIGNFNVVSDIENKPVGGIYEFWYEQAFGNGLDIRAGRMSADEEFMLAESADVFLNGSFSWATLPFKDLPNGGPIPAEVAVRAHVKLGSAWTAMAGLYKGSEDDTSNDPTEASVTGADHGFLAIAELQYATGTDKGSSILPGSYKVGGWFRGGTLTSAPRSNGEAVLFLPDLAQHTASLYAIADHRLTRDLDDEDEGLSAFIRVMAAPNDSNRVTGYVDGGLVYADPFGRKDDEAGLGIVVTQTSATVPSSGEQGDGGLGRAEVAIEATYQAQVAKGIVLQPDVQYIINPAGGRILPSGHVIGDALVLGLRTTVTF